MARVSLYLLIAAVLAPFLYDRLQFLLILRANVPGKYRPINNFKEHEVKFRDQIRNCEDVVLLESEGVAILSCDPGRDRWNTVMGVFHRDTRHESGALWLYTYASPSPSLHPLTLTSFPGPELHPLGIEYEPSTNTLYVINHALTETVLELFTLSLPSSTLTHTRTLSHPLLHSLNSPHALGGGKLFVTNDHYLRARDYPLLSKIETFSGIPGGSVVYIDAHAPSASAKTLARVPFANGIAMLNASTLAVASSSKPGVYFYTVTPEFDLRYETYVRVPSAVDNISVDGKGRLLLAGHPFAPSLVGVAQGRPECDEGGGEVERRACECRAASWAAEWSEEGGLKELYKNGGEEFCSSSTAVRDVGRGLGLITGLYEKGLLVFKD